MTNTDTSRPRRGGSRPGAGRKPIGNAPMETTVPVRMDRAIAEAWGGRGERSANIRALLTTLHDGDAVVMAIDDYEHLVVAPWIAARLAEVEAQDLDDTTLEDCLRALLNALADASNRRHDAAKGEEDGDDR